MRVIGSNPPEAVTVERYLSTDLAEVRLRENINQITMPGIDPETTAQAYQYDEYTLKVPYREGLQAEIEGNIAEWIATGKALETPANASIVADLESQNAGYASVISEMDAAYREGVNSV